MISSLVVENHISDLNSEACSSTRTTLFDHKLYSSKQQSREPGTVANTSTRALSKHKLEFLIKLCSYSSERRERWCFVYTTIASSSVILLFRARTNTNAGIDTETLKRTVDMIDLKGSSKSPCVPATRSAQETIVRFSVIYPEKKSKQIAPHLQLIDPLTVSLAC